MERSYLVSHYHLSFTHSFNQVDIAVFVELLSIFMKELRLRIWTQGLSSPYETLISTPKGLSPLLREMIRLYEVNESCIDYTRFVFVLPVGA